MTHRKLAIIGVAAALLIGAGLGALSPPVTNAPPVRQAPARLQTAADRVEYLYNSFAAGTDPSGNEGFAAAQAAEQQLRRDFLDSFQHAQTGWDQEASQLLNDSLKYGGDRTLDAAAVYWAETQLYLPVTSAEELLAQAKTLQVSDQSGEQEFNATMAAYVSARFQLLNNLAPRLRTVDDDVEGRPVPLTLADLQAQLRFDELERTMRQSARR